MRTFSATQLNKSAQEVFAAVKAEGVVLIEHSRYPNDTFVIKRMDINQTVQDSSGNQYVCTKD